MTLGNIITSFRKKNNISLGAFSKMTGISKSYIHYMETGTSPKTEKPVSPTLDTIITCTRAMGMDLLSVLNKLYPDDIPSIAVLREHPDDKEGFAFSPMSASNLPKDVIPDRRLSLTNENLSSAIREHRLLICPSKIPGIGDLVYVPMKEYGMAVAAEVTNAGGGIFRASAEATGQFVFSIFDLEKTVFSTRGGATRKLDETR